MKTLALVFLLFATTPIVIDSSNLAPGRVVVHEGGARKVAAYREGNTVTVRVEEGKRVDTITIKNEDGKLSIGRGSNGEPRKLLGLDRQPVIVDGIDLEPFLASDSFGTSAAAEPQVIPAPQPRADRPSYYICPRDETMVRVKAGRGPAELKCPLDGTVMKAGAGPDSQYYLLQ